MQKKQTSALLSDCLRFLIGMYYWTPQKARKALLDFSQLRNFICVYVFKI